MSRNTRNLLIAVGTILASWAGTNVLIVLGAFPLPMLVLHMAVTLSAVWWQMVTTR